MLPTNRVSHPALPTVLFASILLLADDQSARSQEHGFPWSCAPTRPAPVQQASNVPQYQTLPAATPAPVAVTPLPGKSGYSYGWFGSQPSYTWSRHFGYSRNFTQWTRK